jgi:hypothetical protein
LRRRFTGCRRCFRRARRGLESSAWDPLAPVRGAPPRGEARCASASRDGGTRPGAACSTPTAFLPFNVTIEGASYNVITLSTNGWIEFGGNTSGGSDVNNGCLPVANHMNPLLAAYWDDLVPFGSNIRYGVVGASLNRVFIADYRWTSSRARNEGSTTCAQVQILSAQPINVATGTSSRTRTGAATIGRGGGAASKAYPLTCTTRPSTTRAVRSGARRPRRARPRDDPPVSRGRAEHRPGPRARRRAGAIRLARIAIPRPPLGTPEELAERGDGVGDRCQQVARGFVDRLVGLAVRRRVGIERRGLGRDSARRCTGVGRP